MIRMIRKTPNFLPAIAGIALMTITACASAAVSDFTKATQDAAIAAAVADARAEAATAQRIAVDAARAAAARCTDPICDNIVKADDLPDYPTAAPSAASTFLTITGTEISIAGIRRANADPTIEKVTRADICEARGGDEPTCTPTKNANNMDDGFQYFQGEFGGSNTLNFAGILPTTNLGAPLTAQPTTAAWPGSYSERGRTPVSLNFNIDFANRRITAEHEPSEGASLRFNLGFSDSGVISGLVLEHDFGLDTGIFASRVATGLIGTEGLVGVFINATTSQAGVRYLGGFVADNPDTNP